MLRGSRSFGDHRNVEGGRQRRIGGLGKGGGVEENKKGREGEMAKKKKKEVKRERGNILDKVTLES